MTTLAQYERARAALAEATRIDEVLSVHAEIEHVKLHARHIRDRTLMAEATEFQMRVERRLGILIQAAQAAGQLATKGRPKAADKCSDSEHFPPATLAEIGVDRKLSSSSQRAASISEMAFDAMVAGMRERLASGKAMVVDPLGAAEKVAKQQRRRDEHASRALDGGSVEDLHALVASGYRAGVIYMDPPWKFRTQSENGEGRSASQHYTTGDIEAIAALPVRELAADDCILHMWMVDWCPGDALELMQRWGFQHKTTSFTWAKENPSGEGFHMGQGYWTRANPEACWLGTRGKPKRLYADVRQLIVAPVMEHSRKPDEIYERIERLSAGPYLELYARRPRAGWTSWGNELAFELPAVLPPHDPDTGEVLEPDESIDIPAFLTRKEPA